MLIFQTFFVLSIISGCIATDLVFTGGTIITFNDSTSDLEVIRGGNLVIADDRIKSIEPESSVTDVWSSSEIINATGKIIIPGFVDTHHHLWQSVFKTIQSNDTLATYFALFGENGLGETNISPVDSYYSQLGGALESLNAGVTTIVDHAHGLWSNLTADAILQANIESGARIFFGYALHNLTNGWTVQDQMRKFSAMCTERLFEESATTMGLAYDFFNIANTDEIRDIASLAQSCNASFITSHYVGGPFLVDNSPELLDQNGILDLDIPVIFSHAAFITEEGRQLLREKNQYIATTPESELQLLFDTHNATRLIQDQAALGVDTNFGFTADIISQARIWLQRLRGLNSENITASGAWPATSPMSVNQAFLLATRQGGLALRRPDLGVIAPGAKADIAVIDTQSPSLWAWNDPVAAVILHSQISDIEHVLVDGKFVKRDFQLTNSNRTAIVNAFRATAARLQTIWTDQPQLDLVGQRFLNVTEYEATDEIDVLRGPGNGYGVLKVIS